MRRPEVPEGGTAKLPRSWRPHLWVRLIATLAVALVALGLLFPQPLNPSWAEGTPASELPWALTLLVIALVAAVSAWVAKVEVTQDRVRVVNPWGVKSIPRNEVKAVRPGVLGTEFVTARGQVLSALAVQCTRVSLGPRPRWLDLAEEVTGITDLPPDTEDLPQTGGLEGLAHIVVLYGAARHYPIVREERGGRLQFHIHVPTKGAVELTLDGEVFTLTFPGGYRWGDFAQEPEEAHEVLTQLLTFIDSYSDPATIEEDTRRRLRRTRHELRLGNGAILRAKGFSKGPPSDGR